MNDDVSVSVPYAVCKLFFNMIYFGTVVQFSIGGIGVKDTFPQYVHRSAKSEKCKKSGYK